MSFPIIYIIIAVIIIAIVEVIQRKVSLNIWKDVLTHPEKIDEFMEYFCEPNSSYVIYRTGQADNPKIIIKNGKIGDQYTTFYKSTWLFGKPTLTTMMLNTMVMRDEQKEKDRQEAEFEVGKG